MKILFCVDDFKGGAGNVVQLLSLELHSRNHDVSICLLGGNTQGRYILDNITIYRLSAPVNRIKRYYHYAVGVRKLVKQCRPDCVVSFLFGVSAFVNLALLGLRIPLIVSERSDPKYLKPRGFLNLLTEFAYIRAKSIIVLFNCFRNISNGRYIDKAFVIPNPVPALNNLNQPQTNYDEGIRFVTIANDTPPKGLDILVNAFSLIANDCPNAKLRIYGSQKDNKLKNQILDLGLEKQVSLMGYTLDIVEPLKWADVYVMPSRHEGFPNSLCEAMSAGKCCIASVCHEGIKELIEDGVNGLLSVPGSPLSIAEKMISLISNPSQIRVMGERATAISEKYSLTSITDLWENEIYRVINL